MSCGILSPDLRSLLGKCELRASTIHLVFVFLAGAGLGLSQAHIDWKTQFEKGSSPDERERTWARENGMQILNLACHEKEDYVRGELPGVAEQLKSSNAEIQVQSAGFFYMLSYCRSDTERLFSGRFYSILSEFALSDAPIKARSNATRAIAESKPEVPSDFVSFFKKQISLGKEELAGPAIFGLARLADREPEASQGLHEILNLAPGAEFRGVAIDAVGATNVRSPLIIHDLGAVMSGKDRTLTVKVLRALQRLGRPAIEINQMQLNSLTASEDKEVKEFAAALLKLLGQ